MDTSNPLYPASPRGLRHSRKNISDHLRAQPGPRRGIALADDVRITPSPASRLLERLYARMDSMYQPVRQIEGGLEGGLEGE
jgi:hypothetical protein